MTTAELRHALAGILTDAEYAVGQLTPRVFSPGPGMGVVVRDLPMDADRIRRALDALERIVEAASPLATCDPDCSCSDCIAAMGDAPEPGTIGRLPADDESNPVIDAASGRREHAGPDCECDGCKAGRREEALETLTEDGDEEATLTDVLAFVRSHDCGFVVTPHIALDAVTFTFYATEWDGTGSESEVYHVRTMAEARLALGY